MKTTKCCLLVAWVAAAGCGSNELQTDGQNEELRPKHRAQKQVALVQEQVNLVADQEGHALKTDPDLINAWGLAFNPRGAAWVSAAGTGLSPVYDAMGNLLLKVSVPTAPTGQAFNPSPDAFMGDVFIIVTEDGTVRGWQPGFRGESALRASEDTAIYKGVAIGQAHAGPRLYAADFFNAKVAVFDDLYRPITVDGGFVDEDLPCGYAPFNIYAHGDHLLVSYALQNDQKRDDVAGPGNGFVDVFDLDGHLITRLISDKALNAPWGMAFAPWKLKGGALQLLVGNFGDGRINRYRITFDCGKPVATLQGPLLTRILEPVVIDGLWAIVFGPGAGGFAADELYFTAGPDDEAHGLFGKLVF